MSEQETDYRRWLGNGAVQAAYRGLLSYIMELRTYFKNHHPDSYVGNLYQGVMDMTYFSFTPEKFKERGLKIAVVFVYEPFRFEVWLAGYNKPAQTKYWTWFKQTGWEKYRLVPSVFGADAILEHVLVENPDFSDPVALTGQIERGALAFVEDVEQFLAACPL